MMREFFVRVTVRGDDTAAPFLEEMGLSTRSVGSETVMAEGVVQLAAGETPAGCHGVLRQALSGAVASQWWDLQKSELEFGDTTGMH